jgi:hypothetical protein
MLYCWCGIVMRVLLSDTVKLTRNVVLKRTLPAVPGVWTKMQETVRSFVCGLLTTCLQSGKPAVGRPASLW